MRTCVILNPSARGDKARRFRHELEAIRIDATLKLTTGPGDARRLAKEAVDEGFEIVVAAGGDGTVNEALNGIGEVPNGFDSTRLAVLPLGTVNVFARELGMPSSPKAAWALIRQGRETLIDLPRVEYFVNGTPQSRYFVQLAGAGLDARAVELVSWKLKKKIGPLAYVLAGLTALREAPAPITATAGSFTATGELVLIGNGRLYGGPFRIFPKADLRDGLLELCVFPRVGWLTLARCGPPLLLLGALPAGVTRDFQAESLSLSSPVPVPLEIDGELVGHLPATFSLARKRLRLITA